MPKVPEYVYSPSTEKSKMALQATRDAVKKKRFFTEDDRRVIARLREINQELGILRAEKRELNTIVKKREQLAAENRLVPVKLYALRLEGDCWYIGMTYNVEKRFKQHVNGKGSGWTRMHKPLYIQETRVTECLFQDAAAKLEDDMTLEYALKYGSSSVRGGGWCQRKPVWPDVVRQNELDHMYVLN